MTPHIDAHLTHLQAVGRSVRTITSRSELLHRVDRHLPAGLLRVTERDLERWLSRYRPGWTLCTYHMHLRGFYAWAATTREPWIDFDPMAGIPRPRSPRSVPKPVTDAEFARALAGSDPRWRLIMMLAAYAGLRVSEIAALAREDVDERHLVVRGKGDVTAMIPTHPALWALIAPAPPGRLVRRRDGDPIAGHTLSMAARRHFNRIGMPRVHLHRFRHWFGTTTQRLYRDLRVTQTLMRHASPATTAGYALVADQQLVDAVGALPLVQAAGRSS